MSAKYRRCALWRVCALYRRPKSNAIPRNLAKSAKLYHPLVILGFALVSGSASGATLFNLTTAQQLYGVVANTFSIENGNTDILGDVGLSNLLAISAGHIEPNAPYTGAAYFSGAINCSPNCTNVLGGAVANTATVTTAISDYNSMATSLIGLGGATNLGALAGGTTLTPGLYDATTITLPTGTTLTLNAQGNSSAQFVIRFSGNLTAAGTGAINLINGATADNIVFLYTGTSSQSWSGNGTFHGIFIDTDPTASHSISFSNSSFTDGRIVHTAGIVDFNNADLTEPISSAPEPSTLGFLGLALGLAGFRFLRKRT